MSALWDTESSSSESDDFFTSDKPTDDYWQQYHQKRKQNRIKSQPNANNVSFHKYQRNFTARNGIYSSYDKPSASKPTSSKHRPLSSGYYLHSNHHHHTFSKHSAISHISDAHLSPNRSVHGKALSTHSAASKKPNKFNSHIVPTSTSLCLPTTSGGVHFNGHSQSMNVSEDSTISPFLRVHHHKKKSTYSVIL